MSCAPGPDPTDPAAVTNVLRTWLLEQTLPFWANVGFDRKFGCFHERLFLDGTPDLTATRRTRVQARQIYVYSHAAVLGWYPKGTRVALEALEFLLRRSRSPDGAPGYVHLLTAEGAVADPLRDTYDHAFLLLALAWLARASGDAQVRTLVDEVLTFFDEHLAAGDGSYHEGVPASEPRRQNPHMHAYEAMLALHDTLAHPQALSRAEALRGLLDTRFVDPDTGTLTEYFDGDWKPRPAKEIEPGHHAEWVWLLRRHEKMAGLPPHPLAPRLLDVAMSCADRSAGLLPDLAFPGRSSDRATYRCWPQTELAKAWTVEFENGRAEAAPAAAIALNNVHACYLSAAVSGGWIDQLSQTGACLVDRIPASTLYHVFVAIAEADRVFGSVRT